MLTPEDIKNLTEYQKTVFVTKDELHEVVADLKQSFSDLQASVDAAMKDKLLREQESAVVAHRMKNAEDWIDKAAPKLEIEFKH
jgi:hypothetical protein